MRVAATVLLVLALIGCSGPQKPSAPTTALLTFDSNVDDAEVWIDDRFFEGALGRGIRLEPGEHRVEIRHDDYHSQYFELTLSAGEKRTLEVRLAEILP